VWWQGRGRCQKHPPIEDTTIYEQQWSLWWATIQPDWRGGHAREHANPRDWTKLHQGGKSGIVLVMITLMWW
ncbi:hypothetical protein K439DRAFT_1300968, partial [Ramaria rubella]